LCGHLGARILLSHTALSTENPQGKEAQQQNAKDDTDDNNRIGRCFGVDNRAVTFDRLKLLALHLNRNLRFLVFDMNRIVFDCLMRGHSGAKNAWSFSG
jgi:hypothetical protein